MRSKTEKRLRFAALPNTRTLNPHWAGQWRAQFRQSEAPLTLEIGTAKGEFLLGLARQFPERNFIGLERKADRLYHIARDAAAEGLSNVWLLRADAYVLTEIFAEGELDQIWLTFPDPYPKDRHTKHRLTHPYFLEQYRRVLCPGGWLDFKTDNAPLFAYTREMLASLGIHPLRVTEDLHASDFADTENTVLTGYERRFRAQGLPTFYLRAVLGGIPPPTTSFR